MAPGSNGNPIEAADLEKFRQNIYNKDRQQLGHQQTVPIQTLSSQLGQNIYNNLAYPFINEWQGEWTVIGGDFVDGGKIDKDNFQRCAETVPIQTWSSQLGQQIYTNLATPFINEWQAGDFADGAAADGYDFVGPWSAVEVDWDSFVFEVPTQTPLPMPRHRACSHDLQDKILQYIDTNDAALLSGEADKHDTRSLASEFSDTSVAPDSRFRYTSEADEAEFEASSSCTSNNGKDTGNSSTDDKAQPPADVFSANWWSQLVSESQKLSKDGASIDHQNETHGELDKFDDKGKGNTALQGMLLPPGQVKRLCKFFTAQNNDKPG